jgi:SNF2 family DNA or RNA helicase
MQILADHTLVVKTRFPARITETIQKSKIVNNYGDGRYEVAVRWGFNEAVTLSKLNVKNVPSTIKRDYKWPRPLGINPFDHQKETASFLSLRQRAFCFNEQGTGKTASVIWAADYLMHLGAIKRVLIVCPLSIMQSAWQQDLFKFAVHRTVDVAYGSADKRKKIASGNAEFVIINYDGIPAISEYMLNDSPFDLIVVDEANAYKNVQTKRWKLMRKMVQDDTWLWMLTGTPAAQSPLDAYGLGRLCVPSRAPRFFGDYRQSVMQQFSMYRWEPRPESEKIVFDMLQPAIRYTKAECLDLPDVTHVTRMAPLSSEQKKYYKELKDQLLLESGGEEVSAVNAAAKMNKLLQISGGAVYTDTGAVMHFDVSDRLRVVEEVIDEASHKVLVFVPFRHTIDLLSQHLTKAGIANDVIHGDVPVRKRTEVFKDFQEKSNIKVLVIQPSSAAHGVTLTAANVIIWYAPVTSTETYLQANARIDRPGQRNPMTIVHIQGSPVENRLYSMLQGNINTHEKLVDLYKKEMAEA